MLINRHFKTTILSIFILITTSIIEDKLFAQAVNDTSIIRQINLDQLIITADRTPVMFEQLKRSIQVISKKEIEQMPVRNISELISYAMNTDVRSRGSFGMQADINIRGGSFDQTLILLNGMNISDPQTGHHNMDIPVDLASINRIEILKGPGARVFGPNAFNGVINIITNQKVDDQLSVSAMGGQYGLYSLSASIIKSFGNTSNNLQISKSVSDGFIYNTDFRTLNIFYNGTTGKTQKLEYQAAYIQKAFGANSFYTPHYPDQYESTKTVFASIRYKTGFKGFSPSVYFRRHYDEFRLFRNAAPSWYITHNYHYTDVVGSNANIYFTTGNHGKLSVGYDVRHELIRSNKLGDSLADPIQVKGVEGTFYTLGKARTSAGLFVEESINLSKFSVSAGLLASYLSALPGKVALYPGADAAFQLNKNFRIYGTANRTLRLPTFTDLYYNDPTSKGDPNLKPEEAISIEAGLKFNKPGIIANAAVFKRYGKNMIDWVKLQDQDPWQAMNVTNIDVVGFESSITLKIEELSGNKSFIKTVTFNYTYLKANKSSDEFMSRYVLDILKHKADLLIYHQMWRNFSASWALSYQDREGGYYKYMSTGYETTETPYKPFVQIDIQLNYTHKNWMVFAEATNLLNTENVDYGNVPQPGRWIRTGIRFNTLLKNHKG
ncbi:MAG: TonB-dependent receptor [Bacteroidales bacterium]|nr:TonB-dependent receptor [Bacteroidales bacterium]